MIFHKIDKFLHKKSIFNVDIFVFPDIFRLLLLLPTSFHLCSAI